MKKKNVSVEGKNKHKETWDRLIIPKGAEAPNTPANRAGEIRRQTLYNEEK